MTTARLSPGLLVIHGNRQETLRALVTGLLRRQPLPPLADEVVLVQSNGIGHWLKLAIAELPDAAGGGGLGIAAGFDVMLPARFLWQAYRAVLGEAAVATESVLDKQPLHWRLHRLLPALARQPAFAVPAAFLADDPDGRKRHQLAAQLADLLDQYQVYRADWLAAWAAGRDDWCDARGQWRPLPSAQAWQPALWRAVLADVGEAGLRDSRAGIHPRFMAAMDRLDGLGPDALPASLPERVIVFGISALPAQAVEALAALSRVCQVVLCVLNPCQFYWGDIVSDHELLRAARPRHPRRGNVASAADLHQHGHPLLAAWGRQGRDYISLLDACEDSTSPTLRQLVDGRIDLFESPDTSRLLGQLQDDILNLRPLAESRECWPPVAPDDGSLRFQLAHSALREVEALHDHLLDAFQRDPSLRPRDVMVMVPDIRTYAPLIAAVFGRHGSDDPRRIPYTIADRQVRGQSPLATVIEQWLSLPDSRLDAVEVIDWLTVPAVARRAGIRPDDLPLLQRWLRAAGVRWGLDADERVALGLPALDANTWRFGLDRLLLGYAIGEGELLDDIVPCAEVGGLDAEVLGRLSGFIDWLAGQRRMLAEAGTPAQWCARLRDLFATGCEAVDEDEQALLLALDQAMARWLTACTRAASAEMLTLAVVRETLLDDLGDEGLTQRFMAGAVNFGTLMPMRAIPFRVVCLMGMNHGDYPRMQPRNDFDLMARDLRPGDRSRREDDRYLMLEALLSARDQLLLSWVGRDVRDNSERPPSVLVSQLRDHVAAGWRLSEPGADLLAALTTEHALQPFSPGYFRADTGLYTYAGEWLPALRGERPARDEQLLQSLPLPDQLALEQLVRFLRDPLAWCFQWRFQVWLDEDEPAPEADEVFAVDTLSRHQQRDRLLLAGRDLPDPASCALALDAALARLQGSGELPLAGFGASSADQLRAEVMDQLVRWQAVRETCEPVAAAPESIEVLLDGLRLATLRPDLHRQADGSLARLVLMAGNLASGRHLRLHKLLAAWAQQVLVTAAGQAFSTRLVGADVTVELPMLTPSDALAQLKRWQQAWARGCQHPLPVAPRTAMAWLQAGGNASPEKAAEAAASTYEGGFNVAGERDRLLLTRRQFPGWTDLSRTDAGPDFATLAEDLYGLLAGSATRCKEREQ